jgi:protein gp37
MSNTMQKSSEERRQIKIMKSIHKEKLKGVSFQSREELVQLPLIIYTKKSKVENYKSTHSYKCFRNSVNDLITSLVDRGYIIHKIYYNNKPYHYGAN